MNEVRSVRASFVFSTPFPSRLQELPDCKFGRTEGVVVGEDITVARSFHTGHLFFQMFDFIFKTLYKVDLHG